MADFSSTLTDTDTTYFSRLGPPVVYAQLVRDSTAGVCRWTSETRTATPDSSITTPNHTNNLIAGEYTVLGIVG